MSALFAATYPDRTWALVLYGGKARELRAPDYPWGQSEAEVLREIAEGRILQEQPGWAEAVARSGSPTATEAEIDALAKLLRHASSPGADEAFSRMNMLIDVRNVLPAIRVPTLVLHNTADRWVEVERGRDLASRIPGSVFAEFPIQGHITPVAEIGAVLDEIEPFLLQTAFVTRTRQGRRATKLAYDHLGIAYKPPPAAPGDSDNLFE